MNLFKKLFNNKNDVVTKGPTFAQKREMVIERQQKTQKAHEELVARNTARYTRIDNNNACREARKLVV